MRPGRRLRVLVAILPSCWLAACGKQQPVLVINAIPDHGVVRGVGSITGTARSKFSIRSVILYLDGKRASEALIQGTEEAKWVAKLDSARWPTGLHYLTAMATARDGEFTQETVTLVIAR